MAEDENRVVGWLCNYIGKEACQVLFTFLTCMDVRFLWLSLLHHPCVWTQGVSIGTDQGASALSFQAG